jgi:hypothetical protein
MIDFNIILHLQNVSRLKFEIHPSHVSFCVLIILIPDSNHHNNGKWRVQLCRFKSCNVLLIDHPIGNYGQPCTVASTHLGLNVLLRNSFSNVFSLRFSVRMRVMNFRFNNSMEFFGSWMTSPSWRRQKVPLKRRSVSTRLRGATSISWYWAWFICK